MGHIIFADKTSAHERHGWVAPDDKAAYLRSLSAEQLEPPSICSATVKRLMIRDHETTRANEQSALAGLLIL
jgi:hypothetical protein